MPRGDKRRRPHGAVTMSTHAAQPDVGIAELAEAADALFYAMRRSRAAIAAQSSGGLSIAQSTMLDPLSSEAELPVGRLAASADVSVPAATRMLQQLENRGVVTRRRSPTDERVVLVRLTAAGAAQLEKVRGELRERQRKTLSELSVGERRDLARQLRRLAQLIADRTE